jgi:hypothetical protein
MLRRYAVNTPMLDCLVRDRRASRPAQRSALSALVQLHLTVKYADDFPEELAALWLALAAAPVRAYPTSPDQHHVCVADAGTMHVNMAVAYLIHGARATANIAATVAAAS